MLQEVLELVNSKGLKFTMEDLAKSLHISKRTLYEQFSSKTELLQFCLSEYFNKVKILEDIIYNNPDIDVITKIKRIIVCQPYANFKPPKLHVINEVKELKDLLHSNLSVGWQKTFQLMDEAVEKKILKPYNKILFRAVIISVMEGLLNEDLVYTEALSEFIETYIEGMKI